MLAVFPPPRLCTDNGAMIAWAGMEQVAAGGYSPPPLGAVDASPRWPLGEPQPASSHQSVQERYE